MIGLALALGAALLGGVFGGGRAGALAAGSFGLLAILIQFAAGRLVRGRMEAPIQAFLTAWGAGMGLRLLGVVLVGVVVWVESPAFPPVPAALGYIGVLVPLLFLEARRV